MAMRYCLSILIFLLPGGGGGGEQRAHQPQAQLWHTTVTNEKYELVIESNVCYHKHGVSSPFWWWQQTLHEFQRQDKSHLHLLHPTSFLSFLYYSYLNITAHKPSVRLSKPSNCKHFMFNAEMMNITTFPCPSHFVWVTQNPREQNLCHVPDTLAVVHESCCPVWDQIIGAQKLTIVDR